ncbi:hypothetical protein MPL3356_110174 [Mesorhizobium plurifarium]|uniref:Uncharacterized protein n=1 Tax=Mesorhizobium plurifarium TaxID=69974 RepID=A0A090DEI7_MESPL|nr:hypothetical protein MPL3356_110174 [Mesorhizobium plurifarium]
MGGAVPACRHFSPATGFVEDHLAEASLSLEFPETALSLLLTTNLSNARDELRGDPRPSERTVPLG